MRLHPASPPVWAHMRAATRTHARGRGTSEWRAATTHSYRLQASARARAARADSPGHDGFPGRYHGHRLLLGKHGLGDLGRVAATPHPTTNPHTTPHGGAHTRNQRHRWEPTRPPLGVPLQHRASNGGHRRGPGPAADPTQGCAIRQRHHGPQAPSAPTHPASTITRRWICTPNTRASCCSSAAMCCPSSKDVVRMSASTKQARWGHEHAQAQMHTPRQRPVHTHKWTRGPIGK